MSDETPHDVIEQLGRDFRKFLDWYVAVNTPKLRETLEEALDDVSHRIAYQLTTPDRSSGQIARAADELGHGVAASTIRLWQQEWIRQGLVRRVSAQKRQRVFDLLELGIDIGADLSNLSDSSDGS